jgi:hypothetical protein
MPAFLILTALIAWSLAVPAEARTTRSGGNQAVPTLDINAGCRDVANMDQSRTVNYPRCMAEERTARAELQKVWHTFSADKQELCLHLVTSPALPSYVTLQECLNMARDAEKLNKSGQNNGLSATEGPR